MVAEGQCWDGSRFIFYHYGFILRVIFALDGKLIKNSILFTLFEHPPNLVQKPLPILVMDLLETCIIFTCIPPQEGVESHLRGFLFKMF